eukprot:12802-Pelagomonas_calceolata.AAC.6
MSFPGAWARANHASMCSAETDQTEVLLLQMKRSKITFRYTSTPVVLDHHDFTILSFPFSRLRARHHRSWCVEHGRALRLPQIMYKISTSTQQSSTCGARPKKERS